MILMKHLEKLLDFAFDLNLFEINTTLERDSFEALIFDQIMPTPSKTKEKI